MELIERYILEVGTYLPKDLRDDVTTELRSNLADTLENRSATDPTQPLDDLAVAILKDLGPPHQLAESYVPKPRVLFGPRLYPAFIRTMKIAIAILATLSFLSVILDFANSMSLMALGGSLISAASNILKGSLVILGIAVVVFAAIERTAEASPEKTEDWDPRTLPAVEDPDKISLGDQVTSIAFVVIGLVVLNFFRGRIVYFTMNGESGWVPLLSAAFFAQLWLLNLALILDLVVNSAVLVRHRWSWALRWANFGVNCLYVVWLFQLASGSSIIAADPAWMVRNGWSAATAAEYEELVESHFVRWVGINLKLGFWAACAGLGYSLFKLFRRMFARL